MTKTIKLMLIDDSDISLFVTQHILQKLNFKGESILMPSGFSALNYIKENIELTEILPDIIILDIEMPILNGWEFIDELSKIKGNIPKIINIFVLSSFLFTEKCEEYTKKQLISGYISKPLKIKNMEQIFESFLISQNLK